MMVLLQKPKNVAVVNKISLFTDEVVSSEYKSTILGFLIILFAEFFYLPVRITISTFLPQFTDRHFSYVLLK